MQYNYPGCLITLEGGEGAGKSTQIAFLRDWLAARGISVICSREPGGSPGAEEIRSLLNLGELDKWDEITEAILINAARRDHVVRKIRPALMRGDWVVCDRFLDSTLVYQGAGSGIPLDILRTLINMAVEGLRPDLTLILYIDPLIGLKRIKRRKSKKTRFDRRDSAFHARVANGFFNLAMTEPERCALIDATQSPKRVAMEISSVVSNLLKNKIKYKN
ncbi:thymidylate kinase [Candidatus Endolissoclinum faulkneri L2]|uniref:Thymidylate kinase n=1 Tax=Candidatus Endolissoclinum faulkneri L2 TaxID=1193729 RepID=K7YIS2_9PROT|nr:dTMP kinase [Candidatus Endolissoclinum faulkneri]AFX99505.1 thymidylate kinase [Candidatus Endolissoclinum faulkneri L2]